MTLNVPSDVLKNSTSEALGGLRESSLRSYGDTVKLQDVQVTDAVAEALREEAQLAGATTFRRVMEAIVAGRKGDFSKAIPSIGAAPQVVIAFLKQDMIDGWVYRRESDGHLHAYLVTDVGVETSQNGDTYLSIRLASNVSGHSGGSRKRGEDWGHTSSISVRKERVARKKVGDILSAENLLHETPELKAEYEATTERYFEVLSTGFAERFSLTGRFGQDYRSVDVEDHPVIHDIAPTEIGAFLDMSETVLLVPKGGSLEALGEDGLAPVPTRPLLRVFNLKTHEDGWVHVSDLTEHEYDLSLRDKLVLPSDQRELLDILTTDIKTFTGDIIEGKSAGNVILGKGTPGVGKTLTAEVYAELIKRPLYAINSGSLGLSADEVRKSLEIIFKRADRWNAVLLLDECDVYVMERGSDIGQNAIVAEFLRTIEYFTGLMFMTTNRANEIDDAIKSRCAAIIDYRVPGREDARRIWKVLAENNEIALSDSLLEELLTAFPDIAPRDIKMLLRLALRVATHRKVELTIDIFGASAIFRGLHRSDVTSGVDAA